MRYVITYINITEEKRYHYVIVILNIDMNTMLTSAPRSSVLSVKNLEFTIISGPQRVYTLILCILMILIIRGLLRMSTFLFKLQLMLMS